jgi:predicted membrane protein
MDTQIRKSRHGIIVGTVLILLGGALIGRNLGLIPQNFHSVIVSWQMLLIVTGIISMVKHRTFHFHGLAMFCIGVFFIIPKLARFFPSTFHCIDEGSFTSVYWPVLLIICGLIIVLHIPVSRRQRCYSRRQFHRYYDNRFNEKNSFFGDRKQSWDAENCSQEENFSRTCIFGSGRYTVVDVEFKGGTVQAIFSGIELDLRKTNLPEGETILNVEAIFGGIEVFVPDSWYIEVAIESVLGGIDDSRRTGGIVDSTRKLIIKGSAVFGGVEIKN